MSATATLDAERPDSLRVTASPGLRAEQGLARGGVVDEAEVLATGITPDELADGRMVDMLRRRRQ